MSGVLNDLANHLRPTRPTTALDQSTVHDILANDRHRWVIEHLTDIDEPTTVRDLARALAFIETDAERPEAVSTTEYKRFYVSLYQTHLPKLAALGIIEFTHDGTVRGLEPAERLADISRTIEEMTGGGV